MIKQKKFTSIKLPCTQISSSIFLIFIRNIINIISPIYKKLEVDLEEATKVKNCLYLNAHSYFLDIPQKQVKFVRSLSDCRCMNYDTKHIKCSDLGLMNLNN